MNIKSRPMGDYQTNCYIVTIDGKDLIIDPGIDALPWIKMNVTEPVAILNTHGHFDHVWSNDVVQKEFNIPIYCPKDDVFMLENDPLMRNTPPSTADVEVEPNETIELLGEKITFHHFPGHTPGCSAIEIGENLFTGDFIFQGSIGRVDFPFSSPEDMKESLKRVISWDKDFIVYTGHGSATNLQKEKNSLKAWLNYL
jgi:glyoxylase-like metal-dependent hydrolase (beta-lactamase superfamily II)